MCDPKSFKPGRPAEDQIADLMRKEMGVQINPQALRMFIRANWRSVSVLAHCIHDEAA
jgi:hypothetical protein